MITVCLSAKRTGSTFLHRCLDSHPDIQAYGEIFFIGQDHWKNRFFLDPYKEETITYKLIYNQAKHFQLTNTLVEKDFSVIHVLRRNPYRKVLSDYVSNIKAANKETESVSPELFLNHVKKYEDDIKFFRQRLKNNHYLEIYMEDYIGVRTKKKTYMKADVAREVCKFLGVDYYKMHSDSKKLTEKDHWEYFDNAKDIKKLLKKEGKL